MLECEESFECSDRFGCELKLDSIVSEYIEFKDSDNWINAYAEVKEVLSRRENLPNGEERKQKRINRAKQAKSYNHRKDTR